ncbi:endocuticle structural glycoprotein ABD-5 isoform X1 [Drosophila mauritiana]|uniref:Endocuticle structural glycoprotein ABD-5 isoform X1 n=1 Tax=Drosophila mauritiana TaxID=7226 RepID=A0A6P8K6Y7_DROMA|nr:endocuticle structural glycoprotein ABD-5 isoform X1 [Drosophila mauritiana]
MQSIFMWLVAFMAIGISLGFPAGEDAQAETIKLESENTGDKYSFAYETSNGISRTETGEVKPGAGEEDGSLSVQGSTSWSAPDGKKYEISFTADETGYHPKFRLVA